MEFKIIMMSILRTLMEKVDNIPEPMRNIGKK